MCSASNVKALNFHYIIRTVTVVAETVILMKHDEILISYVQLCMCFIVLFNHKGNKFNLNCTVHKDPGLKAHKYTVWTGRRIVEY